MREHFSRNGHLMRFSAQLLLSCRHIFFLIPRSYYSRVSVNVMIILQAISKNSIKSKTQFPMLKSRTVPFFLFLFFNQQVTQFTEPQAMADKFYMGLLLFILVISSVHCARLRRPQDAERSPLFLYGNRLQQGCVFRHHDSFRLTVVPFNQIKSIFLSSMA